MIDTIQFSIINSDKYELLLSSLRARQNTKSGFLQGNVPAHRIFHEFSDRKIVTMSKGKFYVASSNYFVTWMEQPLRNRIKFNISIPKFLWGNNVQMFTSHKMDRDFDYQKGNDIRENFYKSYQRLLNFIWQLNDDYFKVRLEDLVLDRIDLCFNQFFQSSVEKKIYLSVLKKKKVKYVTSRSNNPIYQDGIYFNGAYVTYKIYDKGEEFKKNDAQQLRGAGIDPVNLQSIADKCLRYEVEFKRKFFREYMKVQAENFEISPYWNYVRQKFNREDILWHLNSNIGCFKEICFAPKAMNFFNRRLFLLAFGRFWKYLAQWRIEHYDEKTLETKIMDYNFRAKLDKVVNVDKYFDGKKKKFRLRNVKQVNTRKIIRFADDLRKFGKTDLLKLGLYTERTFNRNLVHLKNIGYADSEIISPLVFPDNWNLNRYHDFFISS